MKPGGHWRVKSRVKLGDMESEVRGIRKVKSGEYGVGSKLE